MNEIVACGMSDMCNRTLDFKFCISSKTGNIVFHRRTSKHLQSSDDNWCVRRAKTVSLQYAAYEVVKVQKKGVRHSDGLEVSQESMSLVVLGLGSVLRVRGR
jgi:hypothetical protein